MSNAFLKRRHPIGLYVIAGPIGLVMLMIVGLVVQVVLEPAPERDESYRVPAAPALPGSATGVGANGSPAPGPLGPLQLAQGRKLTRDVSVGYPHTAGGAVSAAVHYWSQIASTLEPERAAEIAAVVADLSWTNAVRDLAHGPVNTREGLGLPTTGRVPEGASVLFTPMQYQVRQARRDSVKVLLLGYYSATVPGNGTTTWVKVFPTQMHWAKGDWKVLEPDDSVDYSTLLARPGSEEAAAMGWNPLTQ